MVVAIVGVVSMRLVVHVVKMRITTLVGGAGVVVPLGVHVKNARGQQIHLYQLVLLMMGLGST